MKPRGSYIKFYAAEWRLETIALTAAERGIYQSILCEIWESRDARVPYDLNVLPRSCGAPKATVAKAIAKLIANGLLQDVDGYLVNERASQVFDDREKRSNASSLVADLPRDFSCTID